MRLQRLRPAGAALLCAVLTATALAAAPPAPTAPATATAANDATVEARLRERLKRSFPGLAIQSIRPAEALGLYELVAADGIVYADPSGEHLFIGQIVETATRRNFTNERWTALNRVDFDTLPFEKAIKTVHGKGTRRIVVFADPDCPFCQELETELAKQDDLTVYTFLYPLENTHPGATRRAHQLWCAPEHAQAWSTWMLQRHMPPEHECADDPIATLATLGDRLHIQSTPTIIFQSGARATGLPATDALVELLAAQSTPPAATAAGAPATASAPLPGGPAVAAPSVAPGT